MEYVDDILITEDDIEGIEDLKRYLNSKFHIKDSEAVKYLLGYIANQSQEFV